MMSADNLVNAITTARQGRSLRQLAADLGLEPDSGSALLSKALAGKPLSADSWRRIGRALGVVKPARRVLRRTMTAAQAARWDAMTRAQRNAALNAEAAAP